MTVIGKIMDHDTNYSLGWFVDDAVVGKGSVLEGLQFIVPLKKGQVISTKKRVNY